ncbi:MAG TPA: glycoside hydrolase family 2 TIM barrel-domain containing protein, partial [Agriterribacter sp.]|nr:glycoside hydrolase family 2 TIM barrel-domain containing protein [Agriterribacter sp.]
MIKSFVICTLLLLSMTVAAQVGGSTEVVYLSGTGADNRVDWDFYCSKGRNSGKWTTIPVPSCWEQEGFGGYYYGYGTGDRLSETGSYRHRFRVPRQWKGKEVKIVFEGVMTDAAVKINGIPAGPVHQGAFYEFSYDISPLVKYGESNTLEVLVKKHSDNKTVNHAERDADYWVFGGIFRPVYLQVKPKENIQRVAIDAKADGSFLADVFLSSAKSGEKIRVEIASAGEDRKMVFEQPVTGLSNQLQATFEKPNLWTPESPYLYTATFILLSADGKKIHAHAEKIGFRTVEVRQSDGIYVNNVRVKLKGVNRHTFHPRYGRTSSKQLSITAVNLIKDMNMNAVRMSHYPPDIHFLEVCDSLGLFVLNELAGWQYPTYDDTTGRKLIREMVTRDVNHPSVILWDNGNEGGWNNNLNEEFGKWDVQKRQVIHPWEDYGSFNNYHYMNYNYLSNDGFNRRKIFMPTEFLHGLYDGGLGAGLEDFWLRMWNDPLCSGGFLWVFADEAVARSDRNG